MAIAKSCPHCGVATTGAKFCGECGQPTGIGVAAVPEQEVPPPPAQNQEEERELWRGKPDEVLNPVASRTTACVLTNECLRVTTGLLGRVAKVLNPSA